MTVTTGDLGAERLILGRYTAPNLITFGAAAASLGACAAAGRQLVAGSMLLLLTAGILDGIDGPVARKYHKIPEDKEFGGQLDTLVDLMSWGLVPSVISYSLGLRGWVDLVILYFYVACAAIRLCHFTVYGAETSDGVRYFRGVPSAYASFIYPISLALGCLLAPGSLAVTLRGTHIVLGFLFILNVPVRDTRSLTWLWVATLGVPAVYWGVAWWLGW